MVLGAGFAWFTVLSFQHYTRETIIRDTAARSGEIWVTAMACSTIRPGCAQLIERRFAPEAQDRFIRISEDGHVLYQSGIPGRRRRAARCRHAITGAQGNVVKLRLGSLFLNRHRYVTPDGRQSSWSSGQSDVFAQGVQRA